MKQSVYNFFQIRLRILGINIANTFNIETAYPAENWANILSTIMYTGSYLLFLNIIFGNVRVIAGYSYNDMLFFSFMGQLAFYSLYNWSYDNVRALGDSVHMGELDLLLTKPIPTLFYVSTRKFTMVRLFRDALLPMFMIGILIHWPDLHLSAAKLVAGIFIFICGQWALHVMQLMMILPVFWQGESQALLRMSYSLTNHSLILEGLTRYWRVFLTTIIPVCLPVAASVSVMLGRSNALYYGLWALSVAVLASFIRIYAWKKAILAYNSASS